MGSRLSEIGKGTPEGQLNVNSKTKLNFQAVNNMTLTF